MSWRIQALARYPYKLYQKMNDRYDPSSFEAKWRQKWKKADLFLTRQDPNRPKFYGLDFFPYPSGAGLSVGHCRNYIPTDVLCRMKYMQGYNVLHPFGFDAFGLPAENEAIKNKTAPGPMVEKYGATYRRQLELVGNGYDWSRSFFSSDPSYYKWNQAIFELLYKKGLAYQKYAAVNWDPIDRTVLADEEVVAGRAERSGAIVEKRYLPQWYFKITAYAQQLLDDLDTIDWPEGIKSQQRNWIGRSEGVQFKMKVVRPESETNETGFEIKRQPLEFEVFTTRIDTIFGVTFCVLAPEHPVVSQLRTIVDEIHFQKVEAYREAATQLTDTDRISETRDKTGVFTGAYAINPATGERIPIWIADYVLASYGTGAIMAVPGHDNRDFEFASKFGIPIKAVIAPSTDPNEPPQLPFISKEGVLINSGEYSGVTVSKAQALLTEQLQAEGIGEKKIQYRLRDWLISRQRYWGCPIPVIHTADGQIQLVPESELPVYLPSVDHYEPSNDGSSPLSKIDEFVNVTDLDGSLGKRETDTMGGFACSSWYFLRFCDPHNDQAMFEKGKIAQWMPVDAYVGGAEHAVMHLLYARFWTKVLYDAGLVPVREPFARLHNQGQVLALTPYRKPKPNEKLAQGEEGILLSFAEAKKIPEDQLIWRWARMSKSKGNVVTPEEAIEQFGADALRIYELFVAPFDADFRWSTEGIQGSVRFLNRIFKLFNDFAPSFDLNWKSNLAANESEFFDLNPELKGVRTKVHKTIKKVTDHIERFSFNTYVSSMMELFNIINDTFRKMPRNAFSDVDFLILSEALESFLILLAPAAPHSCDEIWSNLLGHEAFTYELEWPHFREDLAKDDVITIAIQINGKLRDTIEVQYDASEAEIIELANASEKIIVHKQGKEVRKTIYVPGKLVNIVLS